MAIVNQLSRAPGMPGGEKVYKNYGGTAIPAGMGVLFDGTNKGDAMNPPGIVLPTAAGGVAKTCGITLEAIPAGGVGRVVTRGEAVGIANATLTPGALVQIDDSSGNEGKVKAAASTNELLGRCLTDCVAGDPIVVDVLGGSHN